MALINCSECDRMASDQAAACPHCGAPIAKQTAAVQIPPAQAISRNVGWASVFFCSRSSLFGSYCAKGIALPAG